VTAQDLLQRVRHQGAQQVVASLTSTPSEWDLVLDKIEQGQPDWLKAAAALRAGTDAGNSVGLDVAVSGAIQHNPTGVLQVLGQDLQLSEVCRNGQIEPTPAQVKAFLTRTRAALATVKAPTLIQKRDACLAKLASG
jgi:hypothetical protein